MKRTAKTTKRQTIKMVSWNPARRTWEEIFPEDAVPANEMVVMFWSRNADKYVTNPDAQAADYMAEWLEQIR